MTSWISRLFNRGGNKSKPRVLTKKQRARMAQSAWENYPYKVVKMKPSLLRPEDFHNSHPNAVFAYIPVRDRNYWLFKDFQTERQFRVWASYTEALGGNQYVNDQQEDASNDNQSRVGSHRASTR